MFLVAWNLFPVPLLMWFLSFPVCLGDEFWIGRSALLPVDSNSVLVRFPGSTHFTLCASLSALPSWIMCSLISLVLMILVSVLVSVYFSGFLPVVSATSVL